MFLLTKPTIFPNPRAVLCEILILARNVVPLVHSALTKRQRSQQSAVLAMTMASKAAPSIKAVEPILFRW